MAILPHLTFFPQSDARLRADAFRMYQLVFCWYRPRRASLADSFKNLRTPVILFTLDVLSIVALNAQWELRYPEIPMDQINDITFLNQSTGFFVNSAGRVWMTTNGGTSWKVKAHYQRDVISEIKFLDVNTGIIYEVQETDSTYNYVTIDGGNSRNRYSINDIQYFSSFNKVKFTDTGHLWFANQYGAWLSRDTAKTWTLFPVDGANWAFDFVDSLNGWISIWGGQFKRMAYTTNGGTTWEFIDRPYASQTEDVLAFRGVNYSSRVDVYVAGYDGSLTHFIQEDPFVYDIATYTGNALFSFAAVREGNALHIWLAGDGMTVLHYIAFVTGVQIDDHEVPTTYFLSQNYPNPFNPSTNISFSLPRSANVRLTVIDLLGREVATLVDNEERSAGNHTVAWNAATFASGVYFYRLQAGDFVQTKKLVLLK